MTPHWNDSRLVLLLLAGGALEASGATLRDLWRCASRHGRLDRELQNLERRGLVERSGARELDARMFRITAAGREALAGAIQPEKQWARAWDGKWRLALFDIPQAQAALRTRLRRKLRELRFGWLQNSVWLSPDPLHAVMRLFEHERASAENLAWFEARPAGGATDVELVAAAWDFAKLGRLHASYLEVLRLRPSRERRAQAQAWVHWAQIEQRAWAEILRVDPLLPEVLWPAGYDGRAVWNARTEALLAAGEAVARLGAKA